MKKVLVLLVFGLSMGGCSVTVPGLLTVNYPGVTTPAGGSGAATPAAGSGKRYEVVNQSLSWTDARREAERRGGYLSVITSAEEQRLIESMVTRDGSKRGYWLGGYCENDRVFKWITGEPMNYTNWGTGEPNNLGKGQDKMCFVQKPYNRVIFGQWDDDRYNIGDYGYIIEWN
jgi:hypothetical protein